MDAKKMEGRGNQWYICLQPRGEMEIPVELTFGTKTDARRLCKMKFAAAFAASICLVLITSCGSSGSGSTSVVTTVQAQSGYSNASITGTYSLSLATPYGGLGGGIGSSEAIGSFTADGAGNISAGTLTERGVEPTACNSTFTGTYSLQSTASGTATLAVTSKLTSGPGTCNAKGTLLFSIYAGQSGGSLLFNESDGVLLFSGNAIKQ
jgi:hypothetical protein